MGVAFLPTRYHCTACGNLTRFDVVTTRRTRAFHHFSLAGELRVEDEDVLDAVVEQVSCRWCSATGSAIEAVAGIRSDPGDPAEPGLVEPALVDE